MSINSWETAPLPNDTLAGDANGGHTISVDGPRYTLPQGSLCIDEGSCQGY